MTVPQVRRYMAVIMILLLVAVTGLIGRIAWVQFVDGPKLAQKSRNQLQENKVLQSPRGTIYDRNGRELAISNLRKSLYVNPKEFNKDATDVAAQLAPILGMKPEQVRERLMSSGSFIWLKRTLEPDEAQKVTALIKEQDIKGFAFIEESKRYYPNEDRKSVV